MSWDRYEYDEQSPCACGKGRVIKHRYMEDDDWNRIRSGTLGYDIECPVCKNKYHVQSITRHYFCLPWKGSGVDTREYLVPVGVNLPSPIQESTIQTQTIEEDIASKFTVFELTKVLKDMNDSKYSTRVQLENSKTIVRMFERYEHYKSLSKIIPILQSVIQKYDTFQWHPDTVADYYRREELKIQQTEEMIAKVLTQSYELHFTRM